MAASVSSSFSLEPLPQQGQVIQADAVKANHGRHPGGNSGSVQFIPPNGMPIILKPPSAASCSVLHSQKRPPSSEPPPPHYCFTCAYRFTPIQSKSAILVLIWNFLIFSCLHGIYIVLLRNIVLEIDIIPNTNTWTMALVNVIRVLTWLFYPLAGWLAETYLSRHKMLVYCMVLIWLTSIALAMCSAVVFAYPSVGRGFHLGAYPIIFIVMAVGVGGFQANMIPFGMDQMQGASSRELTSFILWYFWTEYFGFSIVHSYLFHCKLDSRTVALSLAVVQSTLLSVALVLYWCLEDVIDKEPAQGNPLKIIHEVLKYARKHEIPERRSAFTYAEDSIPSGLDLSKQRYGGPFTTEQVESVKSFFRICLVLFALLPISNVNGAAETTTSLFSSHLKRNPPANVSTCFIEATIDNLHYHSIIIIVPIYIFLLKPVFQNLVLPTLHRCVIGIALIVVSRLSKLLIEAFGHAMTDGDVPCLLTTTSDDQRINVDYRWIVIPNTIAGIAYLLTGSSLLEFVCAQGPYALKGFLIGMVYSIIGLGSLIGFLILLIFYLIFKHCPDVPLGCGFWYFLAELALATVGLSMVILVVRWYKPRKRNDLSFEIAHVEHVFDKQLK